MPPPTPLRVDADDVIRLLGLEPLPHEGGAFRETYRAGHEVAGVGDAARAASTQIYYLLRPGETSALHRVRHDEVFHHYLGDPVEQLCLDDAGVTAGNPRAWVWRIGPGLTEAEEGPRSERPQRVVPARVWQGARLADDAGVHGFALLGCTVSPGFDWADFDLAPTDPEPLRRAFPEHGALIEALSPVPGRTRA